MWVLYHKIYKKSNIKNQNESLVDSGTLREIFYAHHEAPPSEFYFQGIKFLKIRGLPLRFSEGHEVFKFILEFTDSNVLVLLSQMLRRR